MNKEFKKLDTEDYACPNCGGKTEFNPKNQSLVCLYCNTTITDLKKNKIIERPIEQLLKEANVWKNADVVQCENCGAKEVVTSSGEIASCCSFCGTNKIVKTSEIVGMKPQGICPFVKTLVDASNIAKQWVKKKKFTTNGFKKSAEIENIKGVYAPAFTFDCRTHTTYRGVLEKTENYTTVDANGFRTTESRSVPVPIAGEHNQSFDDVLVQASSTISNLDMAQIQPFPTQNAVEYDEKYLAGYHATTYSKDGNQVWHECKQTIDHEIRYAILKKYDYDLVRSFTAQTTYSGKSFKYVLLPVYVGHHNYKGKNYKFYINGVTGKISGKAPTSKWKVALLVMSIILIFAILGFILFT